ncbi:MAG: peptide-methionine (S)-S-oxide reductase MsrA [Bacteroidota bacterium]
MKHLFKISIYTMALMCIISCAANSESNNNELASNRAPLAPELLAKLDTAIFASGCFWCTEAIFERVEGVHDVVSGYSGGERKDPTYRQVSAGITKYAEAVRVLFDPEVVTYPELVEMFFASHDPTQVNRQGPDVGAQYRSEIFYRNEGQRKTADKIKKKLDASGKYSRPIATRITAYTNFYDAEDYHQDFYALNPNQGYIKAVSRPKVEKFVKEFNSKLKKQYQHQ